MAKHKIARDFEINSYKGPDRAWHLGFCHGRDYANHNNVMRTCSGEIKDRPDIPDWIPAEEHGRYTKAFDAGMADWDQHLTKTAWSCGYEKGWRSAQAVQEIGEDRSGGCIVPDSIRPKDAETWRNGFHYGVGDFNAHCEVSGNWEWRDAATTEQEKVDGT